MFATESQTQTEDQPPTLAEIVREVTDNGRTIINFLHDVMLNRVEDAKMCHRIAAARELAKLGSKEAEEFLKAVTQSGNGRAPARASGKSPRNDELADIIKQETSDGRDVVRFLVDVMHGNLDGFKPCHRVASAKELLRRGFDDTPMDSAGDDDGDHDDISSPNHVDPDANRYNNEDDPFDFENYDEEQYRRDGGGGRALRHIYGDRETRIVAIDAANHCRHDAHIPDRDFTPAENPEDDPYGKGCYGYNALRFYFRDNQAIRAANKAVEKYKKRKTERPEEETAREGPPVDHWSLDRAGNRSTEADESSEDPDPGESESHKLPNAKDPPKKRPVKIFLGPPDENPRQCRDPGDFHSIWSVGVF